jgi:hypothetical protein
MPRGDDVSFAGHSGRGKPIDEVPQTPIAWRRPEAILLVPSLGGIEGPGASIPPDAIRLDKAHCRSPMRA